MLLLHDRASTARAPSLDLDPQLRLLITRRFAALAEGEFDLTDWTELLVVQPGDTETDIVREVGFSPLKEPTDRIRYPAAGFHPFWDWLVDHGGWFELSVSFGSTFAYILFIQNADGVLPDLLSLCREYAGTQS